MGFADANGVPLSHAEYTRATKPSGVSRMATSSSASAAQRPLPGLRRTRAGQVEPADQATRRRSKTRPCRHAPRSTRCRPARARPARRPAAPAAAPAAIGRIGLLAQLFGFAQFDFAGTLAVRRRPLPGARRQRGGAASVLVVETLGAPPPAAPAPATAQAAEAEPSPPAAAAVPGRPPCGPHEPFESDERGGALAGARRSPPRTRSTPWSRRGSACSTGPCTRRRRRAPTRACAELSPERAVDGADRLRQRRGGRRRPLHRGARGRRPGAGAARGGAGATKSCARRSASPRCSAAASGSTPARPCSCAPAPTSTPAAAARRRCSCGSAWRRCWSSSTARWPIPATRRTWRRCERAARRGRRGSQRRAARRSRRRASATSASCRDLRAVLRAPRLRRAGMPAQGDNDRQVARAGLSAASSTPSEAQARRRATTSSSSDSAMWWASSSAMPSSDGTPITVRPAARAAATPVGESSSATTSGPALDPEPAAGLQVGVGGRLRRRDFVGAEDDVEAILEADDLQRAPDEGERRVGDEADRRAAPPQLVQQLARADHRLHPVLQLGDDQLVQLLDQLGGAARLAEAPLEDAAGDLGRGADQLALVGGVNSSPRRSKRSCSARVQTDSVSSSRPSLSKTTAAGGGASTPDHRRNPHAAERIPSSLSRALPRRDQHAASTTPAPSTSARAS